MNYCFCTRSMALVLYYFSIDNHVNHITKEKTNCPQKLFFHHCLLIELSDSRVCLNSGENRSELTKTDKKALTRLNK